MLTHEFWHHARQSPHRLALVEPNGRHWSRGELQRECNRLAEGLMQREVAPGDCLALILPNCAQFIALALAAASIGSELWTLGTESEANTGADFLEGELPQLLIGGGRLGDAAKSLISINGLSIEESFSAGSIDGFQPYENLLAKSVRERRDKVSATPAKPPMSCTRPGSILATFGIEPEQNNVHYCGLTLADQGVRTWVLDSLHYGHAVILADQWNPQDMLRDIARYRVTTAYMVPAQFTQLLNLPPELRAAYDLSSIRLVVCPVVPCPKPLKQAMMDWWDMSIYECSGTHYLDQMKYAPLQNPAQCHQWH